MKFKLLLPCMFLTTIAVCQIPEKKTVRTSSVIAKGSDLINRLGDLNITDENVYDEEGNFVSPADVKAKLRTYEYIMSVRKLNKFSDFKHVISKINLKIQAQRDSMTKLMLQPENPKLIEGQILDLKPLQKYMSEDQLSGKAIAIFFWSSGYNGSGSNVYSQLNEVFETYRNPDKFEILVVNNLPTEQALRLLEKSPIVNTRLILNAQDVINAYQTKNNMLVLLTDQNHKILYSATSSAEMTPRQLNGYLKAMFK
ncbi:hypothetical protein ACXZ1K_02745 [Pedobacter sp. PWIIR3]